jgi:hypothetical protein
MSVRGESLKSTKNTYVCERRIRHRCPLSILKILLSQTYVSLVDFKDSPLADIGVLGLF